MTAAAAGTPDALLGRAALRGGALVGATQVVKISLQFLSLIVLARLLTPYDFGTAAAAAPLFSLIGLLQDFGFAEAIVQRPVLTEEDLSRIFWVLVGMSLIWALAIAGISPVLAWWFSDRQLIAFCIAASAPVCIANITAVPLGLLNRHLRFGTLTWIDTTAAVGGFTAAVVAAWGGLGYWSLLLASATVTGATALGAWGTVKWRPRGPDWCWPDRQFMAFGANVTGFNFFVFVARNLDNILIGQAWGLIELGYYDRAYKLLTSPLQAIVWPLARVVIPLLSRVQHDLPLLREAFLSSIIVVVLGTAPALATFAAAPTDVVTFLFGRDWVQVAPILFWLCLAGLQQPLNTATSWLLTARGRTDALLRYALFSAITTMSAFCCGLHWGAVGVAAAYAVSEYLARTPVLYWWFGRIGPVRLRDMLALQAPVTGAAALAILLTRMVLRSQLGLHGIALIVAAATLSYGITLGLMLLSGANRRRLRAGASLVLRRRGAMG